MKTKTFFVLFFSLFLVTTLRSQTSMGFNYKTIVTDNNGNPYRNYLIDFKITLKDGSIIIWQEQHDNIDSGPYGICTLVIGEGTRLDGYYSDFDKIRWSNDGNYTISVDIRVGGSSTWDNIVTNEPFQAVPFAKTAETLKTTASGIHLLSYANTPFSFPAGQGIKFTGTNNEDWYIYMDDSNDLRIVNDTHYTMTIYHDSGLVKFYDDIEVGNEIHSTDTGDADLKPFIYGAVNSDGTIVANASTSGFTVTKNSTGEYQIDFTSSLNYDEYIVIVTNINSQVNSSVTRNNDYFTVYTRNISSNSYYDASFQFVVFKK